MSVSVKSCVSSSVNGHDWLNERLDSLSHTGHNELQSPGLQESTLNAGSTGSLNMVEPPQVKPRQQVQQQSNHVSRAQSNETLLGTNNQGQGHYHAQLSQDKADSAPKIKIAIELPWLDLVRTAEASGTLAQTARLPSRDTSQPEEHKTHTLDRIKPIPDGYQGTPVDEIADKKNLPFTFRSVVYRGVGSRPALPIEKSPVQSVDKPDAEEKPVVQPTSESYLSAMTDLDRMIESKVDWTKFEQLEKTVWMAQSDPNCPPFIRQGSVNNYMRILKGALARCKESLEQLKKEADEYYGAHETKLTGIQLQKFAHCRLLADDTINEITLVEKNLNRPNMFSPETEAELLQRKRYPLVTPTQVRERYAKQVRVITEMLALLTELVESAKNDGPDYHAKLFERSE